MVKGPRVVIVTSSEPYPFGHVSARWYYALLKELSRRRYRVRCLSVTTNEQWARLAVQSISPLGVELTLHPISLDRNWLRRKWKTLRFPFSYGLSSDLRAELAKETKRGCDILHLEQLWTGYLAQGHKHSLVVVHHLAALDLKGLGSAWNPRLFMERQLQKRGEARLLRRLSSISTLSQRLASSIRLVNPRAMVHNVPFGLDPSLYPFTSDSPSAEPVIGFLANMRWMPGYLAACRLIRDIFPLVRRSIPNAQLLVAGWDARVALAEFRDLPNVTIAENVPDARSYFARLRVLSYPLPQGSGVKVKVLEAMALGIPVVTTTEGIEGIEAVDGQHCFIADDSSTFADRVIELLRSDDLRRTLRQRARALIELQHSPVPVVNRLEKVYETL